MKNDIEKCICGTLPILTNCSGRWIISCPNKKCNANICSYPEKDLAIRRWKDEVDRFKKEKQEKEWEKSRPPRKNIFSVERGKPNA